MRFSIAGSESYAVNSPTVASYFGSHSTVNAGGDIIVEASVSPGAGTPPDYRILSVSGDQLQVIGHGLATGDSVEYDNGAPPATSGNTITGLVGSKYGTDDDGNQDTTVTIRRTYNVIEGTDADHLYLGSIFNGQACTATSTSCINLANDTITFDGAHNLADRQRGALRAAGRLDLGRRAHDLLGHLLRRRPRRPQVPASSQRRRRRSTRPTGTTRTSRPPTSRARRSTWPTTTRRVHGRRSPTTPRCRSSSRARRSTRPITTARRPRSAARTTTGSSSSAIRGSSDTGSPRTTTSSTASRSSDDQPAIAIGGLTNNTIYRVHFIDANTIQLKYISAASYTVDFARGGASGDQIVRNPAAGDTLGWADFGYAAGQTLIVTNASAVNGNGTYKISSVSGNTITLCASGCGSGIDAANDRVTTTTITGSFTFTRGANGTTHDTITSPSSLDNTNLTSGTITITSGAYAGSYAIDSRSGNVLTLSNIQGFATTQTYSTTMHKPVTASLDEPIIPLAPVKDLAVTANVTLNRADPLVSTSRDTIVLSTGTWTQFAANSRFTLSNTLFNDGTYEVESVSGGTLTLKRRTDGSPALVQTEVVVGARLALLHQAVNDIHSLIKVGDLPLALSTGGTLVDGQTYYAKGVDSTHFTIAATNGGAALSFVNVARNGNSNILVSGATTTLNATARHSFTGVVDLTGTGTGDQQLRIAASGSVPPAARSGSSAPAASR